MKLKVLFLTFLVSAHIAVAAPGDKAEVSVATPRSWCSRMVGIPGKLIAGARAVLRPHLTKIGRWRATGRLKKWSDIPYFTREALKQEYAQFSETFWYHSGLRSRAFRARDTLSLIAKLKDDGTDLALQALNLAFRNEQVLGYPLLSRGGVNGAEFLDFGWRTQKVKPGDEIFNNTSISLLVREKNARKLAEWVLLELVPSVKQTITNQLVERAVQNDRDVRASAFQVLAKLGAQAGEVFRARLVLIQDQGFRRQLESEARAATKTVIPVVTKKYVGDRIEYYPGHWDRDPIFGPREVIGERVTPVYEYPPVDVGGPFFP